MKTQTKYVNFLKPLFKRYYGRPHPLQFKNYYQLIVMVILSARSSDKAINNLAPSLFKAYPNFKKLSTAKSEDLYALIKASGNYRVKSELIVALAHVLRNNKNLPATMDQLIALPGIGRKSANVIMSQMGVPAEGIIVDLHTLRVAPRLGIAIGKNPEKIEKQLMEIVDKKNWHTLGMSLTLLGREICRPTNPKCPECLMNAVCEFYKEQKK